MIIKDKDSTKDQNEALRTCRGKLAKTLSIIKPKLIISLGAVALKQLLKKAKITENRGRFFYSEEFGCQVFVTVHPNFVLRGASQDFWKKPRAERTMLENLLFEDFKQVKQFMETGKVPSLDVSEYREGTAEDLQQLAKFKVVAFDFETTGLRLEDPEIRPLCVSFCGEPGNSTVYFYDQKKGFPKGVKDILTNSKIAKVVANRPFDERVCRSKLGYEVRGQIHDVFTMAHLIDENYRKYNLGSLAEIYTPLKGIKDLAEGKRGSLEDLDRDKLIAYSSIDSDATLRVYRVLAAKLREDPALLRYYLKFTKPVQDMLSDIYYNGTPVDIKQLSADEKELTELRDKLEDEALMLIPREIREDPKHIKKQKLSRVALVRDYLFAHPKGLKLKPNQKYLTPKTRLPQISEKHIKQFAGVPFIKVYLRMSKASKVLGTYLKKYWGVILPDGKVYPSMLLWRTATGRGVLKDPEIMTIPKRSEFAKYAKRCFVAPEGWTMGARDLGTSEIRILGWLAGDPNILESLRKGIDIHKRTAAIVNGMPVEEVTDEQRQKAKAINFGFCIAAGQLVLTNSGLVPIEDVTVDMLVWDGVEWVSHDGVVFNGIREVITYDGLTATSNHQVFLEDGRVIPFGEAASEMGRPRLAVGESEGHAIKITHNHQQENNRMREVQESRGSMQPLREEVLALRGFGTSRCNNGMPLSTRCEVQAGPTSACFGKPVRFNTTANNKSEGFKLDSLRRAWDSTALRIKRALYSLGARGSAASDVQGSSNRPGGQQRELRTRESSTSYVTAEQLQHQEKQTGVVLGATFATAPCVAFVENGLPCSTVFGRLDCEASGSGPIARSDSEEGQAGVRWEKVYDIINAGPRNRFTVSGKLVHNCYGMSARGFQAYAKDSYDSEFTEEECNRAREAFFAYPGGYYRLPEYYRKQEREASVTGQVRSPLGRIRHLPDAQSQDRMLRSAAFRQAVNSPTQSMSSDLAFIALYLFWKEVAKRGWTDVVKPTWMIHDADMFLARDDYFSRAMQLLKECMEEGSKKYVLENFGVEIGYPITSDGEGGPTWAAMAKWDDEKLSFKVKDKKETAPVAKPKKGRVVISEEVDLDEDFA